MCQHLGSHCSSAKLLRVWVAVPIPHRCVLQPVIVSLAPCISIWLKSASAFSAPKLHQQLSQNSTLNWSVRILKPYITLENPFLKIPTQASNVIAWLKLVGEMKHLEFMPWFLYLPSSFSVLLGWILSSHAKARWAINKVAACLADVKALRCQKTQSHAPCATHCNIASHWFTGFTGFFSISSRARLQTVTSATPSARSEILVMHVRFMFHISVSACSCIVMRPRFICHLLPFARSGA